MRRTAGCRLRVEVKHTSGGWKWAEYDSMSVESEPDLYRLHVTGYQGDAIADSRNGGLWLANGMAFSTPDADNDSYGSGSCASERGAGWWFAYCTSSVLHGDALYRYWYTPGVDASRMMLRCDAAI